MMKPPPPEKVAEALSAVADGRVRMFDGRAIVTSSDRKKEYTVSWNGDVYTSSDSATYWQGYAGYPVIAVLLLQGRLSFNDETAARFSGINWTELNARYKRNYAAALAAVMEGIKDRGGDTGAISAELDALYARLNSLPLTIKRGAVKPRK